MPDSIAYAWNRVISAAVMDAELGPRQQVPAPATATSAGAFDADFDL